MVWTVSLPESQSQWCLIIRFRRRSTLGRILYKGWHLSAPHSEISYINSACGLSPGINLRAPVTVINCILCHLLLSSIYSVPDWQCVGCVAQKRNDRYITVEATCDRNIECVRYNSVVKRRKNVSITGAVELEVRSSSTKLYIISLPVSIFTADALTYSLLTYLRSPLQSSSLRPCHRWSGHRDDRVFVCTQLASTSGDGMLRN